MKLLVGCILFFLGSVCTINATEYVIVKGDTIGVIAQKTQCTVEEISKLNGISPPKYIVHVGDVIRYISTEDIYLAKKWIEIYMDTISIDEAERVVMQRMHQALESNNIKYDEGGVGGIYADEVLILADAQKTK